MEYSVRESASRGEEEGMDMLVGATKKAMKIEAHFVLSVLFCFRFANSVLRLENNSVIP
jgi:hypothetical protein